MNAYEEILKSFPSKVSLGYETICIYRGSERDSGQMGYSVSSGGGSLTGDGDGHWHAHWIVIGYEELCGDPIFIDTARDGFPVYTAPHGEGRWDATSIAVSLESFGKSLSAIAQIAKNREFPTALEMSTYRGREGNDHSCHKAGKPRIRPRILGNTSQPMMNLPSLWS